MASGRRTARRQAVFILYQRDLLGLTPQAALERPEGEKLDAFARELVLGTTEEQGRIDMLLEEHLAGWNLERLGFLERAILRIATAELIRDPGVPEAVVIDEAVRLAKRFCSAEAGALVNGVLGSLVTSPDVRTAETAEPTESSS